MKLVFAVGFFGLAIALFGLTSMKANEGESHPSRELALDNPEEAGQVHWERDLEAAKQVSAKTGKPILILFQEIPG